MSQLLAAGSVRRSILAPVLLVAALIAGLPHAVGLPLRASMLVDHLVVSEIVTGGASASDELIEIYNPTAAPLPLEGLELVYASASGLTISRRAAWGLGAPEVPPGHHVLVANELGVYAGIADAVYASGIAATGGSVALRVIGAASAIDAVGWGTAASAWMEGTAAPPPPAGSSIERRPGGSVGSTQDTDDNATDFAVREVPDPRNAASAPVPDPDATPTPSTTPGATPDGTPAPTTTASIGPSGSPTETPGTVLDVATVRGLPDGTTVTIEGVALSDSAFTDGGGFVADGTGGIAVLVTGAAFARGETLRLTGEVDQRYAQRTLRVAAAGLVSLGSGPEPAPVATSTGSIGESVEGRLVRIAGTIVGGPTALAAGPAYDLDDGSGPVRVLVATTTGIDLGAWARDASVELVGIASQRDSGGTGTAGYRVLPRGASDVLHVAAPPTPTPDGSTGPSGSASPAPSDGSAAVISIADARALPKNAPATVRGVVTMPAGVVDPTTAVVQDESGGIVLRLGDEVGVLARGTRVEVAGVRSTLSGMETLRVTTPARTLGSTAEPAAVPVRTGQAGEGHEARLVVARGAIVASPRRSSLGTVSFEIDDGSGPLRVAVGGSLRLDSTALPAGTWVTVAGVLGQETTGSQPTRGHRIWPRSLAEIVVSAPAGSGAAGGSTGAGTGSATDAGAGEDGSAPASTLENVGGAVDPGLPIGATLVVGPWEELDLAGVLWDGERVVGIDAAAAAAVRTVIGERRPPIALEIAALAASGASKQAELPLVMPTAGPGALVAGAGPVAPPATELPGPDDLPRWVALVGRLTDDGSRLRPAASAADIRLDHACAEAGRPRAGLVGIVGIGVPGGGRVIVPCDGVVTAADLARSLPDVVGDAAGGALVRATPATGLGPERPSDRTLPLLPAGLLGLGAFALVAGGIAARRLASDEDPEPPMDDAGDADADTAVSPGGQVPALTLVPLPRERLP